MIKKINNKGQSLIEYLLLVAVMGVASIGIVQILSHTVRAKFAQVTRGLNGNEERIHTTQPTEEFYRSRSMNDFFKKSGEQN